MASQVRQDFVSELQKRFTTVRKLENSQSLFEIGDGAARVYIRYSKKHSRDRTFYGLRERDLRELEGIHSFICFLWDHQAEPLLVPFADYEEVFASTAAAPDGQYKCQVFIEPDGCTLYIAQAGRFNVEPHFGWDSLMTATETADGDRVTALTHSQVQTLLGSIGSAKGFDVWIPSSDRSRLDWSVSAPFSCRDELPRGYEEAASILSEIDVLWIHRGGSAVRALFEVEYSTPVYSGLLRLNDVHLLAPHARLKCNIVSSDGRRALFVRQLNRPTFRVSGLSDLCGFLEYANVYHWHQRMQRLEPETGDE